jgi:uncharacterized FAD-dependent dehydrogenase
MNLEKNKLIRLEEVVLGLDESEEGLRIKISHILGIEEKEIIDYTIARKNIDSRHKHIFFVYTLDVRVKDILAVKTWDARYRVRLYEPFVYQRNFLGKKKSDGNIVIVGSGPCGLFAALLLSEAGLKPVLIERGKNIDERVKDVEIFSQTGILHADSNVQFGEGGAGTFSDGKLYTSVNDRRSQYIFAELIKAGAPADIAWRGDPHIGTDRLREVIKNIRRKIILFGGKIRFETCLTGLKIKENRLIAAILNKEERIAADDLILAIGHSARDTYAMLYAHNLQMEPKPFSIGLRIEHQSGMINKSQYGEVYNHPQLGAARYKLVQHLRNKRAVYTFCMCPGGYVIGAASEEGGVVVNGMSEYAQDADNSNSALLVPVMPEDFFSHHPLSGIEFQRHWERRAYSAGGGKYHAPVQLVGDFLKRRMSRNIKSVKPSYRPGFNFAELDACLPNYASASLREALPLLDTKLKGFSHPDAVLTGVETRSSSPVRIIRDKKYESNIFGIYPAGEGAGYAGGIVSSALDGLRIAEVIIAKYIR